MTEGKCLICDKEINRNGNASVRGRGSRAVTCSKKCARTYLHVCQYISHRIKNKLLKELKEDGS